MGLVPSGVLLPLLALLLSVAWVSVGAWTYAGISGRVGALAIAQGDVIVREVGIALRNTGPSDEVLDDR